MATTPGDNFLPTVADVAGASGWEAWIIPVLHKLDACVYLNVIQRSLNTPAVGPAAGARYHIGASPTGAWSGQAGKIAVYRGAAWEFFTPAKGWIMTSQADTGHIYVYEVSSFVDFASGTSLADYKDSVRVATTANGTLASAFENGDTVDGVTLATGDRVLLKNQSSGAENGIYTVNASGAPTRATDFDADAEVTDGCIIPVERGTANGDKLFQLTTNNPITIGSTALTFVVISAAALALDDLTDVVITSAATKQIIEHNGSNWINIYPKYDMEFAASDETTAITTGTGKTEKQVMRVFTVSEIVITLTTAQASGSIFTVDINVGGSSILSTKLTIDNTEKTSRTAATAAVISSADVPVNSVITVDVDQVGDGTAKGLKVYILGREKV